MRTRPSHTAPTRWMRVLCGALVAAFATLVATVSHISAGGEVPAPAAIALSLALSIPLCIALAGRTLSLWRTVVAVGFSQALFHGLFSELSSSGTVVMSEHLGHNGMSMTVAGAGTSMAAGHSTTMWLAHSAAAVLTVIALRYAEIALLRVRSTASLFLGSLTVTLSAVRIFGETGAPRIGCSRTILPRDLTLLFSALRHRGPPALRAA